METQHIPDSSKQLVKQGRITRFGGDWTISASCLRMHCKRAVISAHSRPMNAIWLVLENGRAEAPSSTIDVVITAESHRNVRLCSAEAG